MLVIHHFSQLMKRIPLPDVDAYGSAAAGASRTRLPPPTPPGQKACARGFGSGFGGTGSGLCAMTTLSGIFTGRSSSVATCKESSFARLGSASPSTTSAGGAEVVSFAAGFWASAACLATPLAF